MLKIKSFWFHSPSDVGRGSYYNMTTPYSARFHPWRCHLVFSSDNGVAITKIIAKHANCSVVAAQMSTEHYWTKKGHTCLIKNKGNCQFMKNVNLPKVGWLKKECCFTDIASWLEKNLKLEHIWGNQSVYCFEKSLFSK